MSFFNNIGNLFTNPINTIGSGISYFDNSGLGHFFTNTLNSTSNFLSGLSNIPSVFGNLVNSISNNSSSFMIALIGVGAIMLINDFKGSSSSSYNSYRSYS